jgi:hypothetical protein
MKWLFATLKTLKPAETIAGKRPDGTIEFLVTTVPLVGRGFGFRKA